MGWKDDPVTTTNDAPKASWELDTVVKPPTPEYLKQFRAAAPPGEPAWQKALPAVGATIGGIAGFASPVPGGAAAGALAGTALGASIGTSAEQLLRTARGAEPSVESARTNPQEGRAALMLNEQIGNVAEQSLLEMGGQAIGAIAGAGVRAVSPTVRPGAAAAQAALQAKGGSLSAAQAVDSGAIDVVEAFARAGAGGKGVFKRFERGNTEALQGLADDVIASVSKAPLNARAPGKFFQVAITKGDEVHGAAASEMFTDFQRQISPANLNAMGLLPESRRFVSEISDKFTKAGSQPDGTLNKILKFVQNLPQNPSVEDIVFVRSQINAIKRDLEKNIMSPDERALGAAKTLVSTLDKDIKASLPSNLYDTYREISEFYAKGKDAFNNKLITGLIANHASEVGETLFKAGSVEPIIQAKASLRQVAQQINERNATLVARGEQPLPQVSPKDIWGRLQAGFLEAKMKGPNWGEKELPPDIANWLKSLEKAKTDKTMTVMFTPAQRASIENFANTAKMAAQNKPANFGVLAPLIQSSAITTLGGGAVGYAAAGSEGAMLGAGAALASPFALAKLLTTPKAVDVLMRGLELGPKAMESPAVFAKLVSGLNDAMKEGD